MTSTPALAEAILARVAFEVERLGLEDRVHINTSPDGQFLQVQFEDSPAVRPDESLDFEASAGGADQLLTLLRDYSRPFR